MFKINPTAYASVFVLPCDVVDKHLRLAGSAQLKALLWLCRNSSGGDIEELSKLLGLSKADTLDALQYWIDCSLIIDEENPVPPSAFAPSAASQNENSAADNGDKQLISAKNDSVQTQIELPDLPVIKPTMQQVAARSSESNAIRELFLEAQKILGRTIGYDAQSSLLMLHDHYGLPAEVIIMLCEYARSHNKQNSMNYITKLGKDWAEREIDSFDKAVEQIKNLEEVAKIWQKLKVLAGISTPQPTASQQKFLSRWSGEWKFSIEMIYAAYEEMAEKTGKISFAYMDKILSEWHNLSLKTPEDVEAQKELRRKEIDDVKDKPKPKIPPKVKNNNTNKPSNTSYDLDEAEHRAHHEPLIYKKKG